MHRISVFVPTYNRADYLPRLYESLLRQTFKDFTWLLIDDGSTDTTGELVNKWIKDGRIDIQYHYQQNQGKHFAYNRAIQLCKTELFIDIDSDDYLLDNAIERLVYNWDNLKSKDNISGAIAHCIKCDGSLIGDEFPQGLEFSDTFELRYNHNVWGDKGMLYSTKILQQFRLPEIKGEWVMESILHNRIAQKYKSLIIHEKLIVKEYLPTGISFGVNNLIMRSLNSKVIQFNELNMFNLSTKQYIYVNNRYVKNSLLLNISPAAIRQNAINKRFYFPIVYFLGYFKYKNALYKLNKMKFI